MKIVISSYAYYPSIGGLEEVTDLLAHEFVARGHAVKILTMTSSPALDNLPFEVLRRPTPKELIRAIGWADIYLQQNISLRLGWPLLFVRRPWVVAQHGPLGEHGGLRGAKRLLKGMAIRFAHEVVACSRAVAQEIGQDVAVITNPYRDAQFRLLYAGKRECDLVFLGRLVSDKGAILLLEALALLRGRGLTPSLAIIGAGPEEQLLRARCTALGLDDQVRFAGLIRGERLVEELNRCRIMVIPSVWEEPFGVVALEGIACGCVVVAAQAGGLPEAIGPCGVTFPKGDVAALVDRLGELLDDEGRIAALRVGALAHLERHRPSMVTETYLRALERANRTSTTR